MTGLTFIKLHNYNYCKIRQGSYRPISAEVPTDTCAVSYLFMPRLKEEKKLDNKTLCSVHRDNADIQGMLKDLVKL